VIAALALGVGLLNAAALIFLMRALRRALDRILAAGYTPRHPAEHIAIDRRLRRLETHAGIGRAPEWAQPQERIQ